MECLKKDDSDSLFEIPSDDEPQPLDLSMGKEESK